MKIGPVKEVFKNLFKKPMTVMFPEEVVEIPERNRGRHHLDIDNCISCGSCAKICPNRAIRMIEAPLISRRNIPRHIHK